MTVKIGDLVRIASEDELFTCLEVYGESGVVVEIDDTTAPEVLSILFPDQILSFYSDSVEVVSHT